MDLYRLYAYGGNDASSSSNGQSENRNVKQEAKNNDGPLVASNNEWMPINFSDQLLSIINEEMGIRAKLQEESRMFSNEVLIVIKEAVANTVEKMQLFRQYIVNYLEALLRNVFATYQPLYCPSEQHLFAYDPVALRQFDCNLVQRRLECVIKCTVECVSQMPGWVPSFFSLERTSDLITTMSAFVHFLLVYPTYNFTDGSPNYYEAKSSDVPSNDVRRFFGFWLNYCHNMSVDFTEMALLLGLALNSACRFLDATPIYQNRFNRAEEIIQSTLMSYCLGRNFPEGSPTATDRWIMLNRNLKSLFAGIFESGKLSFAEIGSKLLDRSQSFHSAEDSLYLNGSTSSSLSTNSNGSICSSSSVNQDVNGISGHHMVSMDQSGQFHHASTSHHLHSQSSSQEDLEVNMAMEGDWKEEEAGGDEDRRRRQRDGSLDNYANSASPMSSPNGSSSRPSSEYPTSPEDNEEPEREMGSQQHDDDEQTNE